MADLTPKQEKFAHAFVETSNASEAYRRAYSTENMSGAAIQVEASRLMDHPIVSLLIKDLKADLVERHKITVDDLIRELEEARQAAYGGERPQAAAMVAASMGKAKLLGLEAPSKVELSGKLDHRMALDDFYGDSES